jgi:AraC-like DNA-binding protein
VGELIELLREGGFDPEAGSANPTSHEETIRCELASALFDPLRDAIRQWQALARYYLSNSAFELNEAAYLLGFEDPNSFGQLRRTRLSARKTFSIKPYQFRTA